MDPVSDEEINILLTNLLPLNGLSGTQLDIARSVLTYFLKDAESVTAHINIQNDIEMVVEGALMGPLPYRASSAPSRFGIHQVRTSLENH